MTVLRRPMSEFVMMRSTGARANHSRCLHHVSVLLNAGHLNRAWILTGEVVIFDSLAKIVINLFVLYQIASKLYYLYTGKLIDPSEL